MTDTEKYIKSSYTFKEVNDLRKELSLEQKIDISTEVIRRAFNLSKHNVAIAFSGGKDSTVLCDLIERFLPEEFSRVLCIFGNTGCEFPESIRFARKYGREHFGGGAFTKPSF